ncbi:nucleosome assembly protein-domain-containing protein [Sporodiniella umbellata]|nr:nucleosome assembly protein-domain-containing protein [Sporodiniella umbellata]
MDQQAVDIKSKKATAPTPQNTPINAAPISSKSVPSVPSISEESEGNPNLGATDPNNHALLNMLHGKLGDLANEPPSAAVQRRINGLKYFQSKHSELEGEFQKEVLALEKKYLELYRPLYDKRAQVISGEYEPTEEEVNAGAKIDEDEAEEGETEAEEGKEKQDAKGVPQFWLTALKTHPHIGDTITEDDASALKHLVDIRLSYLEKPGFKLDFEFSENEFFTNKILTKTYYYQDNVSGGDYVYDHAEGCNIEWKEGKDFTVTIETKKQRHKGTNKTRVVKRTVPAESFFHFFSPPILPEDDEELDEEEAEGLDAKLEADYEMGEEFKEKLIPHAVDFYTGKALEYEDYEDESDFDEDGFDSEELDIEEDIDDDDEDDDDDDDDKPTKTENAPECKQS